MYHPDREPAGYGEWLQSKRPEPLVNAVTLQSAADWVNAGEHAFRDGGLPISRTSEQIAGLRAQHTLAMRSGRQYLFH